MRKITVQLGAVRGDAGVSCLVLAKQRAIQPAAVCDLIQPARELHRRVNYSHNYIHKK